MNRQADGFTLIEVVITMAVVAILAAILVPAIANNIESARYARAQGDIATIGKSIVQFRQDLSRWPVFNAAGNGAAILTGPGTIPAAAAGGTWQGRTPLVTLDFHMVTGLFTAPNGYNRGPSTDGTPASNGPYYSQTPTDPWGSAYMVNALNLPGGSAENLTRRVFVLSAGTDRETDTDYTGTADLGDDDAAYRLQ
ncbi:MAG: prepilin-type N-terminal cleavage/methylation domain-containing protein [bacterium]|nr:prepilin-type N-terminal cleavage/methylation domain-containing protein [bacterium]